ncbi:MAG: electron transport complex subunit RsxC [Gammaproteobacteria bacterium]|jgi:electron transport complex protein RnfC|nr:electron transport complex subunit RsxC [Xanthomonadales bacterium]
MVGQTQTLYQFHGGVVLEHHKSDSLTNGLSELPLAKKLYISLEVGKGNYAIPVVNIGEVVKKGQIIAEPQNKSGVYVHASGSGVVTDISERISANPTAKLNPVIEITTDGKEEWLQSIDIENNKSLTPSEIITQIRQAGLLGMGGAGFPTHLKYNENNQIHTLIVNGAECEPYISCDAQLMLSFPEQLFDGIDLMMKASNAKRAIIAIEDQTGKIEPKLNEIITQRKLSSVSAVKVPTIYPTGGEKQLIRVLTGKDVPSGGLPLNLGIIVQNIGTIKALADYCNESKPLVQRIVTVAGDRISKPQNFIIPIGTPINHILQAVNCNIQDSDEVIIGGPMMGYSVTELSAGIEKTTNCILVMSKKPKPQSPTMPCIRCGECVSVCPAELLPQQLHWYINGGNLEKAREHHLFDCIECGACSWVCPSQINLVQYYQYAKAELKYLDYKKNKSDAAKLRHENREARLEQLKQERMNKRKRTRSTTARDPEKIKMEIQASVERAKLAKQQKEKGDE